MARVLLNGLASIVSGKLGGLVYQRSAAGQIVKARSSPANPRTLRQVKSRNFQFTVTQEWLALTEPQRLNWQGWANYMQTQQINNSQLFIDGRQSFLKANHDRLEYGHPILINPTYDKCGLIPYTLGLSIFGGVLNGFMNRAATPASEFLIIFMSRPRPITWNTPQGSLKLLVFTTAASATQNLTAAYIALYDTLPVSGDTVFYKYTNAGLQSGRILPFQTRKFTFP